MTVSSFPKSARLVPTVGLMGSTKVSGCLTEKVLQQRLTDYPKPATTISYKEYISTTEFTSFADQKQISKVRYKIYNSDTKVH
jgi:hypothetical protein